ncbi:MAG TPA: DUF4419 domain-containing protein [Humisphaera sp.]
MPTQSQTASRPGVTFRVADVTPAAAPLAEVPYREAVETALGTPVESCPSRLHTKLVPAFYNPFVHAAHLAFDGHRPLAIAPDHVWLLVCQGFAAHVNANAEALRHKVVDFAGKRRIEVRRDEFVKGSMENPWEDVFAEFADKLREHVGPVAETFTPRFSTTGPVEVAACHVTLMDAVKPYFEYGFASGCGIPTVTLEGTESDWADLRDRAQSFRTYDLGWWIDPLTTLLDQFRAAAAGQPDLGWWRSFYKLKSFSGGPYVTGHIVKLFPYLKDYETKAATVRNPHLTADEWGPTSTSFPSGLSTAPFEWTVRGPTSEQKHGMEFIGGFVGVRQSPDGGTLRPEIGWAVRSR